MSKTIGGVRLMNWFAVVVMAVMVAAFVYGFILGTKGAKR